MSSRWEYTYDEHGNRTGLIEVDMPDETDTPVQTPINHWYSEIEQEIERRISASTYRYHIKPMEKAIHAAELTVLGRSGLNGLNRATYEDVKEYWYRDPDETTSVERVPVIEHDKDYIASQIQKLVGSYGVHSMTAYDIYDVLNTVSACYESADCRGLDKPLLTFTIPDRLRKVG